MATRMTRRAAYGAPIHGFADERCRVVDDRVSQPLGKRASSSRIRA